MYLAMMQLWSDANSNACSILMSIDIFKNGINSPITPPVPLYLVVYSKNIIHHGITSEIQVSICFSISMHSLFFFCFFFRAVALAFESWWKEADTLESDANVYFQSREFMDLSTKIHNQHKNQNLKFETC